MSEQMGGAREGRSTERDQPPAPLLLPSASRPASAEILAELRRFHHGAATARRDALPVGLRPASLPLPEAADPLRSGDASPAAAPLLLLAEVARETWRQAWSRWRHDHEPMIRALRGLLAHRGAAEPSADRLEHGLGALGSRFFDTGILATRLKRRTAGQDRSPEGHDPQRTTRLERALEALASAPDASSQESAGAIVLDRALAGESGEGLDRLARSVGLEARAAEDPCLEAALLFERHAGALARVLAAQRCARLELGGAYRPELHDAALEAFDWRAFHDQELHLLPPIVVVLSAGQALAGGMSSLSRLLRSGRPIQVMVPVDPASRPGSTSDADPEGYRPEIAYLGLGHRGAFVHQGSSVDPDRLRRCFARALASTGTALHVVDRLDIAGNDAPHAAAALSARAHPCFVFDPHGGADWSSRFSLEGNPQVDADWPARAVPVAGASATAVNGQQTLDLPFTYADYVLWRDTRPGELHPVDDDLQCDALVPLADWLRGPAAAGEGSIPFIWAVDGTGRLLRLVVRHSLAFEARDRLDFWHTLQQLGGVHDPYAEAARHEDLETLEERLREQRERLQAEHGAALEQCRQQVAKEVVQRLVQGLAPG